MKKLLLAPLVFLITPVWAANFCEVPAKYLGMEVPMLINLDHVLTLVEHPVTKFVGISFVGDKVRTVETAVSMKNFKDLCL